MSLPVDRRMFLPEVVYLRSPHSGLLEPISRRDDPEIWEALAASDEAVTTQIGKSKIYPTSSASAPWVMKQMIEALRLKPGMRVLEIGTGTGYNAACLAALGAEVVSVEIDAELADQARDTLRAAKITGVMVITGDGEFGAPAWAPFDRVIATAAAKVVPYAWVEQTADQGLIVAPYTGEGHKGGMVVLTVSGGVARGKVEGDATFMPLRGQRIDQPTLQAIETRTDLQVEVTPQGQRLF